MAIPIIKDWEKYFSNPHEGLGSSYERIILNELLFDVVKRYNITSALESPAFGFTGLSGINLMGLAKQDLSISLEDHDAKRIELIKALWQELGLHLSIKQNSDYCALDYADNSFDLGFNFSALWFVQDIVKFISQLCRVCSKAILLCVPNRNGIGYKMQIKDYSPEKYPTLKPGHIDPFTLKTLMHKNGWKLIAENYIDCPPWPDIGMNKELFFQKLKGMQTASAAIKEPDTPVTILPYYKGEDPNWPDKMLSFSRVERYAPIWFKKYWAHHYYLLFIPSVGSDADPSSVSVVALASHTTVGSDAVPTKSSAKL